MNSQEYMMKELRQLAQIQSGEVFFLVLEQLKGIRELLEWQKADILEQRAGATEREVREREEFMNQTRQLAEEQFERVAAYNAELVQRTQTEHIAMYHQRIATNVKGN